jgi:tryptophan synthase beta chain
MGEIDTERQAPNVNKMKMLGATVIPVKSGSKVLKDATNEALRDWISHPTDTHYIIGSVVGPHPYPDMVSQFQSIISEEIKLQLKEETGTDLPNKVVACVGGGSNAIGAFYHFLNNREVMLYGVEAAGKGIRSGFSAATIALGTPGVLHGSKTILIQNKEGQVEEAHSISAGLDYPGIGPQHAHLHATKRVAFVSVTDEEALEAALSVAKVEGIIPALESSHAFAFLPRLEVKRDQSVVVCLSGSGEKDMATYIARMSRDGGHNG